MGAPVFPSGPVELRISLRCDLAEVRRVAWRTLEFLEAQSCTREDCLDCELALVEACNNAIQNAAPEACRTPVMVQVRCDPKLIEMRITDHTAGFEWPKQPVLPPPESEHGRGIYLIRSLMDQTEYHHRAGENTLVLRRRRRQPAR